MPVFLQVFIFAFGTVIGSFLNAVAWRLRTREGFIFGRSYCPICRHELAAVDLVPILSYLVLGGRCRYCRRRINPSYLLVEGVMGLLFLLSARELLVFPEVSALALAELFFQWYCFAILTLVFVYDFKYMLILRSVTMSAAVIAFAANWAMGGKPFHLLTAAIFLGAFFHLQFVISKGRWIGGGDAYLGLAIGAMLGWPSALAALFLAYVSGAIVGLGLISTGRKSWGSQMPFGTFLSASAAVTLLWGERIISWYLSLIML